MGVLRGTTPPPPPILEFARFVVVVLVLVLLALDVLLSSVVRDPLLTDTGGSPRFWPPVPLLPAIPAELVPGDPRSPPSTAIALCCCCCKCCCCRRSVSKEVHCSNELSVDVVGVASCCGLTIPWWLELSWRASGGTSGGGIATKISCWSSG